MRKLLLYCCILYFTSVVYGEEKVPEKNKTLFGRLFSSDTSNSTNHLEESHDLQSDNVSNHNEFVIIPEKVRKLSDKESNLFLKKVTERESVRSKIDMLSRILNDTKSDILEVNDFLLKEYKLQTSQNLVFSSKDWKVYEYDKYGNIGKELLTFKSQKDFNVFSGMYYEKQSLMDTYKVLRNLVLQQKLEYMSVAAQLEKGFSINESEKYKYDDKEKVLYKLVKEKKE